MRTHFSCLILVLSLTLTAGGCSSVPQGEAKYPTGADRNATENANDIYAKPDSIFGKGGLRLFGRSENGGAGETGIGVNSFLWRASLDTVAFMPLTSADPFGGVILTDWYSDPATPEERFKLNVLILDRQLRSDAVQVKVFRQVRRGGEWRDSDVAGDTARQIEDAILTRARQMRVGQAG